MPGSHLFRNDTGAGRTDDDIMEWARGKVHPATGEPLAIRKLACPRGSVVVMMTHATHGVGAPVCLPGLTCPPDQPSASLTASVRVQTRSPTAQSGAGR